MSRGRRYFALAALAVVPAIAGCSAGGDDARADDPVTIYVSLPLRGLSGVDGRDAADGARFALADAGRRAGEREVDAVFLDDTAGPGERARWTPAKAAENARAATEDSSTIAYIGDFESGATRTSLPITNEARVLQVSPASAASDLVVEPGTFDDVPEEAQPSGERTFGRVIPSDETQGRAGAGWAEEMAVRRVATISDGTAFGDELVSAFEDALERATVTRRGAELVYYGREPGREPASLPQSLPDRLMASDAELPPQDVATQASGTLITSAALDPAQLPPAGRQFVDRFRAEYDRDPGRYAAYGYEAMAIVLDSIERAGDDGADREAVVDAFFDTTDRASVLGNYSIDDLGETTLDRLTGYRLANGEIRPIAELSVR